MDNHKTQIMQKCQDLFSIPDNQFNLRPFASKSGTTPCQTNVKYKWPHEEANIPDRCLFFNLPYTNVVDSPVSISELKEPQWIDVIGGGGYSKQEYTMESRYSHQTPPMNNHLIIGQEHNF